MYKSADSVLCIYKSAGSRLREAAKVIQRGDWSVLELNGRQIGGLHLSKDNQILRSAINKKYRGMGLYSKLLGETAKARGTLKSDTTLSGPATSGWLRLKRNAPVEVNPKAEIIRWTAEDAADPFWGAEMRSKGGRVGGAESSSVPGWDDSSGAGTEHRGDLRRQAAVFSLKKPKGWTR